MSSVLPVVSVRVAGLPADALDEPHAAEMAGELDRHWESSRIAQEKAALLSGPLYALIPDLDGRQADRRTALRLRRDVHNGRRTAATAAAEVLVRSLLNEAAAQDLSDWADAQQAAADAKSTIGKLLPQAAVATGRAVRRSLATPAIAASLAFASAHFTRALLDPREWGPAQIRTAMAYHARTTAKTSPFGALTTLTTASLLPIDAETRDPARPAAATSGGGGATDARPTLEPGGVGARDLISPLPLAVHLLLACAVHPRWSRHLRFQLNPSLRRVGDGWQVMLPHYSPAQGGMLPVRIDDIAVLEAPPDGPATGCHPLAEWEGDGSVGARWRALRWVAAGLLLPETPWERGDPAQLARLAARMAQAELGATPAGGTSQPAHGAASPVKAGAGGPDEPPDALAAAEARRLGEALDGLAAAEARMGNAGAAERIRLDAAFRAHAGNAFRTLQGPVPHWLGSTPLFHENVPTSADIVPRLPDGLRDDLEHLGRFLRPHVFRSALYDHLVDDFVERFGPGGRCDDVLGYLYRFTQRSDYTRVLRRVSMMDAAPTGPPTAAGPLGTVGVPYVTVLLQLDEAGRLIVNQVHSGAAGLLARWAEVPGVGDHLSTQLRPWLRSLYPGAMIVQMSAGGDYSPAQALRGRLFPELRWPSDLPAAAEVGRAPGDDGIALDGLLLMHDAASGTLQLLACSDRSSVSVVYLGVIPQGRLHGPVRLLTLLGNPWILGPLPPDAGGGVLLRRPGVAVRAEDIPRPEAPDEDAAVYLIRLDVWRRANAIPRQGFVQVGRSKPMWVDFCSPHSVRLLAKETDVPGADVRFTPPLPDPRHSWLIDGDGSPRAAELAALIRV